MKKLAIFLLLAAMLITSSGCNQTIPEETDAATKSIISETEPITEAVTESAAETETEPETEMPTVYTSFDDREDYLYIGVYNFQKNAHTEEHIKDLAESGVDYVLMFNQIHREALDLFAKYGVGAIVTGALPTSQFTYNRFKAKLEKLEDHPAIWGIYFADEPTAVNFPTMGKHHRWVSELAPDKLIYVNLFPYGASTARSEEDKHNSQLGTFTYEEYIQKYCEYFDTDFICFDDYPYSWAKQNLAPGISEYYECFRIVSEICHEVGRDVWFVGQVNSSRKHTFITTNQIRFQAFTGMAFGATHIEWACYSAGWWYNQILDEEGNKTEQYEKMKTVNWEVHTIAEEYMKYRNVTTHFVGFDPECPEMKKVKKEPVTSLYTDVFSDVKADNGAKLVIGEMESKKNDTSRALMICASDDPGDVDNKSYNIIFRADNRAVRAIGGNGEIPVTQLEDGSYSVPICSNAGILILAE